MIPVTDETDAVVSIVMPIRDGRAFVEEVVRGIDSTVGSLFRHYEIVVVDDGSRDGTVEIVGELQRTIPNLQLYCLTMTSGFDVALIAGLDNSVGDFVITMNPETDPVDLIPVLWKQVLQGNEFVCGVSQKGRTVRARIFRRAFEATTGLRIPEGASQYRMYSRRIVGYIGRSTDRHLMIQALPFFSSNKVATFEYSPLNRKGGFGEGTFFDALIRSMTILLASSARPLRLLTVTAILASFLSLFFVAWVMGVALFKRHVVEGWISLALPTAVIFFLMSTMLGVISEYLYMLTQHGRDRPVYSIVKESTSSIIHARTALNVIDNRRQSVPTDPAVPNPAVPNPAVPNPDVPDPDIPLVRDTVT